MLLYVSAITHFAMVFDRIEKDMQQLLLRIADMLHYTKSLLNYLTSQVRKRVPGQIFKVGCTYNHDFGMLDIMFEMA